MISLKVTIYAKKSDKLRNILCDITEGNYAMKYGELRNTLCDITEGNYICQEIC